MFSFRAKLSDTLKVSDNVEQLFRQLPDFILALQAEIFVFQFFEACQNLRGYKNTAQCPHTEYNGI